MPPSYLLLPASLNFEVTDLPRPLFATLGDSVPLPPPVVITFCPLAAVSFLGLPFPSDDLLESADASRISFLFLRGGGLVPSKTLNVLVEPQRQISGHGWKPLSTLASNITIIWSLETSPTAIVP